MSIEWPKCMDGACPKCGSRQTYSGYGFAAGPLGAYTLCENCDHVLELSPDVEGMTDEQAAAAHRLAEEILAKSQGEKKLQPGPYWADLPGGHRYRLWFHGDRWTYTMTPKPGRRDLPCEVHPDKFIRLERA